tara:strand:- start:3742 stop:4794 length:1053 start_codon:yes stop_codon:yes gene_type:complete
LENLEVKKNFWRNKKVLITGNLGFKGSWLCLQLDFLKASIYGIDNKSSNSSLISNHLKKYLKKQYLCDVKDLKKLKMIIAKVNPDIIIHLAAQPLVIESVQNPISTFEVNILGTVNILEASRNQKKLKSILIVTTDKVYKNNEKNTYFSENNELGGDDPYSASKASAEIICNSFNNSFFKNSKINLASARAGNVIGGGDVSPNRLVPDIFRAIKKNNNLKIRNKNHVRPWQHVLDCNNGYLTLIEKLYFSNDYSGSWNFSSNYRNYTVQNICDEFSKKLNLKYTYSKKINNEKKTLALNSFKSRRKLKWKNYLSFKKMISSTIYWYNNFLNGQKADLICIEQIKEYYLSK